MKKEPKFLICKHCGNLLTLVNESGAPLTCCGDTMTLLTANTEDAAVEKHIPVVTKTGSVYEVVVGSVEHPMVEEHFIQWVYMETEKGFQLKYLNPGDKPKVTFKVDDDEPIAFYEYCNLHGLWKVEK